MTRAFDIDQHVFAPVALGRVGPGDPHAQDQAQRIDDHETLLAKGFLARVVAVAVLFEDASVLTLRTLGNKDRLVEYFRPRRRSAILSVEQWAALPDSIIVRELRYAVERPGFRTRNVVFARSLLDPTQCPKSDLADLYRRRWQVEVDLRHFKQTLGMTMLKCKNTDGVLKEMMALVYNLIRQVMIKSACHQRVPSDRVSFIDALCWLQAGGKEHRLGRLILNLIRMNRTTCT